LFSGSSVAYRFPPIVLEINIPQVDLYVNILMKRHTRSRR
jgi:hypothetical protein